MLPSFLLSSLMWLSTVSALPNPILAERAACDCTGTRDGGSNSKEYICRDARLGPLKLPRKLPLSTFVESYNRFGGLTPAQFLLTWTDEKEATDTLHRMVSNLMLKAMQSMEA
ncbi:hypothetical protein NXS19_006892 [Fusarium pseudograminearum]|nr:hypothetical protein NXS19_006892 [Fusarium pseudograminearum]